MVFHLFIYIYKSQSYYGWRNRNECCWKFLGHLRRCDDLHLYMFMPNVWSWYFSERNYSEKINGNVNLPRWSSFFDFSFSAFCEVRTQGCNAVYVDCDLHDIETLWYSAPQTAFYQVLSLKRWQTSSDYSWDILTTCSSVAKSSFKSFISRIPLQK